MPTYTQIRRRRRAQEAKVKRGLDNAFPTTKAKKPASATAGMSDRQKAKYYEVQAAKNLTAARKVEASGTGNTKASTTHRNVAVQYVAKARALRGVKKKGTK